MGWRLYLEADILRDTAAYGKPFMRKIDRHASPLLPLPGPQRSRPQRPSYRLCALAAELAPSPSSPASPPVAPSGKDFNRYVAPWATIDPPPEALLSTPEQRAWVALGATLAVALALEASANTRGPGEAVVVAATGASACARGHRRRSVPAALERSLAARAARGSPRPPCPQSILYGLSSPLAAVAGWLFADFATGIYHWAIDNFGDGSTPLVGKQIADFQGHHHQPWVITQRQFCNNIYRICIPASAFMAAALALPLPPEADSFVAVSSGSRGLANNDAGLGPAGRTPILLLLLLP